VTLTLDPPGVLVGALFAFITSFDELVVALFLSAPAPSRCPRMWEDLRFSSSHHRRLSTLHDGC